MRTVFFAPPLATVSGGLATIYRVASNLRGLGYDAAVTSMGAQGREVPAGLESWPDVPFLPWAHALQKDDLFCLPEGWPNTLAHAAKAGARSVVYCQNWAYLLDVLPAGTSWKQLTHSFLALSFLAVSSPVAWFMREVFGLEVRGIVPPAVDPVFFRPGERPSSHIRVAWMPRKNKALGEQMQQIALAVLEREKNAPRVEFVAIKGLSLEHVAETLSGCHIFLATGFPEGFGLPPLEAMAAGCVPVGFTGFGGWEYMRQAEAGYAPQGGFVPEAKGDGNGWYVADGDTVAGGLCLARAVTQAWQQTTLWQRTSQAARNTANYYTNESQIRALQRIWPALYQGDRLCTG